MWIFWWCIVLLVQSAIAIQMGEPEESAFSYCLRTGQAGSVMACAGMAALKKLQTIQNDPSYNLVDGVTLLKDEHFTRGLDDHHFVGRDPLDFRGIFESVATAMSQRTLHWDMDSIYPGLGLRLGPSNSGNGVLEFVFDPVRETLHSVKEVPSTGRVLTRQFVIPFLMGFKFNVATLIPILFGIIAILAKKALVVSKLALVISSAVGLGSLLFGNQLGGNFNTYGGSGGSYGGYHHSPHYSNRYHTHPQHFKEEMHKSSSIPQDDDRQEGAETMFTETHYRGSVVASEDDPLVLAGHLENLYSKRERKQSGRNFAWNEADNKPT